MALPNLAWTPEVARETAHLYEKVKAIIPPIEWPFHAPYVKAINELKKQRNAVILAHNYQTPEIYNCVADVVGDSLQLARIAEQSEADVIVQGGVHFMAETSKILSPDKTVLIPDSKAGCSLAASITGEDVRALKRKYPGVPVVAYVNTSAEVKAEVGHLLHLVQCGEDCRKPRRRHRHHGSRPIPRRERRAPDAGQNHRLAWRLRSPRAFHARGTAGLSRGRSGRSS